VFVLSVCPLEANVYCEKTTNSIETSSEFSRDFWRRKTRVTGLSCGVVYVILRLAVLIQYRSVTDTHTDTHDSIYWAIA